MELAQLANLGEFLGGVAVLVTLIYVGAQLRQTRLVLTRAAERDWFRDNTAAVHYAGADNEMADIWIRGVNDYRSLSPAESWRFDTALFTWLASFQVTFHDREQGFDTPDRKVVHETTIKQILRMPGVSQWWSERHGWFDGSFQREVARILADDAVSANPPVRGVE